VESRPKAEARGTSLLDEEPPPGAHRPPGRRHCGQGFGRDGIPGKRRVAEVFDDERVAHGVIEHMVNAAAGKPNSPPRWTAARERSQRPHAGHIFPLRRNSS